MSNLFLEETSEAQAASGGRRVDAVAAAAAGPVMVSDGSQVARLVGEVLTEMLPSAEELAEWTRAGHRTRVIEEHPWIVEQLVGAKITEGRFKMMVEGALRPGEVGTAIYSLTTLQYNGVWRVAEFAVMAGTTVRMDGERRLSEAVSGTAEDDLRFVNGATELAPQTKATIRWRVKWIDAAGATDIKRDIHGREPQSMEVVDGSRGSTNAVLAEMAKVMGKLADATVKPADAAPEVVVAPPAAAVVAPVRAPVMKEALAEAVSAEVKKQKAERDAAKATLGLPPKGD